MITAKDHNANTSIFRYLAVLINETISDCSPLDVNKPDVFVHSVEFTGACNIIVFNPNKDHDYQLALIISRQNDDMRASGTITIQSEPFIAPRSVHTSTPSNQLALTRLIHFVEGLCHYGFDVLVESPDTDLQKNTSI